MSTLTIHAQNGQFSQFFSTGAYLNPAFSAFETSASIYVNFKSELSAEDGSVNKLTHSTITYPIQRTTSFIAQSAAVGLTMVQEHSGYQGVLQTTNIVLSGAYVLPFDPSGQKLISFGLQGGLIQHRLNHSDLTFGSQYNPYIGYDHTLPGEGLEQNTRTIPIFNFGIALSVRDHRNAILSRNSLVVGLSADNLNTPNEGFLGERKRFILLKAIASSRHKISRVYYIHPSCYVLTSHSGFQVNGGMYLSRYLGAQLNTLVQIGTWYRLQDSFIFLAGMKYRTWKVGVSLDLNSQSINPNEVINVQGFQPSFEISVGYNLRFNDGPIKVTNPLF